MAEILASHIDKILRKGGMVCSEFSVEEMLDQQVALFAYLLDKDLFIEVYRNQLARRLLQEKSEDIEFEKMMITKLKLQCGMSTIKHLEGMIADLILTQEDIKLYENVQEQQRYGGGINDDNLDSQPVNKMEFQV